jgi:release factor glutamine methyltransferase
MGRHVTTVRQVLEQGIQRLIRAGQASPRLEARVLLSYVLGVETAMLYAYPEREVSLEQEQQLLSLIERRAHGEPVAYLIGHKEFYGLDFLVDKRVLIPRPETELLVEAALENIRSRLNAGQIPIVADIGTGSGAIPITLAVKERRLPYLYATDISADALEVARLNCKQHGVERRIRLLQGDLVEPLPEPVDILTANLPYVGTDEMKALAHDVVDYEPHLALFSGPSGLDLLQRFLRTVWQSEVLRKGGCMLLEVGYAQKEALTHLLSELWPSAVVVWKKDYAGWDRLLQVGI